MKKENHGRVKTKGYNISLRYNYSRWFNIGGTFNSMNARDEEKYRAGGTQQESLTYGQRIPNQPYLYANFDASFTWHDLFANMISITQIQVEVIASFWFQIGFSCFQVFITEKLFGCGKSVCFFVG